MMQWRQWYVDDKAIPPEMNARFNRCHACLEAFKRGKNELCSIHQSEIRKYSDSRPAPPPEMKHGAIRTEWTAHVRD